MDIAERLNGVWGVHWQRFLNPFRVSGGAASGASRGVVFVGESPHTDEVSSGSTPEDRFPLAGESGKIVTEALACVFREGERDQPVGALAPDWLSIVNVSEVPLDPAAYQRLVAKGTVALDAQARPTLEEWLKLMYSLQLVKNGPVASHRKEDFANEVDRHIEDDFRCRVTSAVGCTTQLIVFLGCTAKGYYRKLFPECGVPTEFASHPSPRSGSTTGWIDDDVRQRIQAIACQRS